MTKNEAVRLTREQVEEVWEWVQRMYLNSVPSPYPSAIARLRAPFNMALRSDRDAIIEKALREIEILATWKPESTLAYRDVVNESVAKAIHILKTPKEPTDEQD